MNVAASYGRSRPGWTRVEIIVAVVVALTALGLVVAFLVRSRDPAERAQCALQLAMMGKAVNAFHTERNTLPASCIAPGYASWAVQLAPYLEQEGGKPLEKWDLGLSYYDQDASVREGQVWAFYCPARRRPIQLSTSGDGLKAGGNVANLAGALGDYGCTPTSDNSAWPWMSLDADGAFIVGDVLEQQGNRIVRWQSRTTLAMLERGKAYTILLGEKHVKLDTFGKGQDGDSSVYNGDHPAAFARLADKAHGLAQGPASDFNNNFGSWHPGICQFLMADTSLRVFNNHVSPDVVQKLIPRDLPN